MAKQYSRIYNLTVEQTQVILGTLLGDGSISIQKGGITPRIQMRHSSKQKEWFYWKANCLSSLASSKAIHDQKSDGFGKVNKLHFETLSQPALLAIYDLVCPNGVKTVSKAWLDQLQPQGLMVLWLDDGGLTGENKGKLNTQGFGKEGSQLIADFLKTNYGITARVEPFYLTYKQETRTYYALMLYQLALIDFLTIIMPYVPCASMLYKFRLVYDDPIKQQHWITKMKKALPQFEAEIDALYQDHS